MKLSEIIVDLESIEQGRWIDDIPEMPDLRLKLRGIDNSDWRRIRSKMVDAIPRQWRGERRAEELDRIISVLLADTVIQDWEGITDNDGKPILYSREWARRFCLEPQFRKLRDNIFIAAQQVGDSNHVKQEELEKN